MTADTDVSKEQIDMSYKVKLQTLNKLSMRHQVCPGETCILLVSFIFCPSSDAFARYFLLPSNS